MHCVKKDDIIIIIDFYTYKGDTDMNMNEQFMTMIRSVVTPATGCTEPVAIALNASTARAELKGKLKKATVKMDICF